MSIKSNAWGRIAGVSGWVFERARSRNVTFFKTPIMQVECCMKHCGCAGVLRNKVIQCDDDWSYGRWVQQGCCGGNSKRGVSRVKNVLATGGLLRKRKHRCSDPGISCAIKVVWLVYNIVHGWSGAEQSSWYYYTHPKKGTRFWPQFLCVVIRLLWGAHDCIMRDMFNGDNMHDQWRCWWVKWGQHNGGRKGLVFMHIVQHLSNTLNKRLGDHVTQHVLMCCIHWRYEPPGQWLGMFSCKPFCMKKHPFGDTSTEHKWLRHLAHVGVVATTIPMFTVGGKYGRVMILVMLSIGVATWECLLMGVFSFLTLPNDCCLLIAWHCNTCTKCLYRFGHVGYMGW